MPFNRYRKRIWRRSFKMLRSRNIAFSRYNRQHIRLRKMLRRRRNKPELKKLTVAKVYQMGSSARMTQRLSPAIIEVGAGSDDRIGQEIKFMKVLWRGNMQCTYPVLPVPITEVPTSLIRLIVWSPRIDFEEADTYFDAIELHEPVDWNVATVYWDRVVQLGLTGTAVRNPDAATGPVQPYFFNGSPPVPPRRPFKKIFKFPRKIKFREGNDSVSPQDSLYVTIINPEPSYGFHCNSYVRTTFIDP